MKGVAGKVLHVDLSEGGMESKTLEESILRSYLGGVGLAARILYDRGGRADPLGPENPLIMAPGLLVGTGFPTASKTIFMAKSPLTGGVGRAAAGAWVGVALKRAGFDALIIEGRAEAPTMLYIDDGSSSMEDASKLWGLNVREAARKIKDRYGGASTAVIGPAGERLSLIAGIDCEERQAARTGLGAVMGSKRLKAIAVKGTGRVEYADPDSLRVLSLKWSKTLREDPKSELQRKYGTPEFYDWMNRDRGVFPSRNWQHGYFKASYDKLEGNERSGLDPYYWAPKYTFKNRACPYCNKPCGRIFRITSGKYAGTELDGPEYETIYSLGGALEVDDPEAVARLHMECDLLGFDGISAGLTIAWAMEAHERGLLSTEDLDGVDLRFGNADAALEALRRMAYRKGRLGRLLADGVKVASERLGKNSDRFAIHVKGLELPAYDVRGLKGVGLSFAVSVRGADHLNAVCYSTELKGTWWKFSGVDRFSSKNKGFMVKLHEDMMTLYDALGICKFSRGFFYVEELPPVIEAVTGARLEVSELFTIGERIYNLERAYNAREGLSRMDDRLPHRILWEPIPEGPSAGSCVTPLELEEMLDEYYAARGWSEDGIPTKAKLTQLDLFKEAEEIGA
ncbi:MAG: aldehyde ferredoxin oxidoreductase family protein [Candidatus Bathyarchaeia archaeon]|nr:aldehyde ferredoxin oxidoreductase family protein [Candidatus Bathyarchaeota archaeon]